MNVAQPCLRRPCSSVVVLATALSAMVIPTVARAESCVLAAQHAGMTFPVEKVDPDWTCRIKLVVDNYVTANKVGPIRTALSETMYLYLLDHPPLAAALINRLDLGRYKAEIQGPGRYWGDDGEGTEGIVRLVYKDHTSRIYYLEGTHHSRLLLNISGKAVVFLRMTPLKQGNWGEAMDSTMVAYTRLDNRILSGLASLLRPLIGGTVARKLAKGVETVNRLGLEMRHHPDRVLLEAEGPPPLPVDDVAFLKQVLADVHEPNGTNRKSQLAK